MVRYARADRCVPLSGVGAAADFSPGACAVPSASGRPESSPCRRETRDGSRKSVTAWRRAWGRILAGVILNVMPCVLPVIPLKVLGLAAQAGQSRARLVALGLAFAGGIMLFFAGIAGTNIFLKLVMGSAALLGRTLPVHRLSMGDGRPDVRYGGQPDGLVHGAGPPPRSEAEAAMSARGGMLGAVGMGLLTGVLATPCSFGYLTSALAFAQSQSIALGSAVIMTIGLGMALPYAILSAFPGLINRLPRPGRWMEILEQTMGVAMLLVGLWLAATASQDARPYWWGSLAVVVGMAGWMGGWWVRSPGPARATVRTMAMTLVVVATFVAVPCAAPLSK